MQNNIRIAYFLSFLWRSWFWLGIWVFYYLQFTEYAGIGLLESIMITVSTIGEIPTGVIADLIGKRKAVIVAFGLAALGNLIMAMATSYQMLVMSIVTMTLGGAFYSGAMEALVYDTLKQVKSESGFDKVIARMNSMQNLGMAIASVTGGFLYKIDNSLPFYMVALFYMIGMVISFWLSEPSVDTEKYSWNVFVTQNKQGFLQLFANKKVAFLSLSLLVPGAFMIATENVINDATAIQLGFDSVQLGIFATILYLFGVVVSEYSNKFVKYIGNVSAYIFVIFAYFVTLIAMPKLGMILGAIILLLRFGVATVFSNYESVRLNEVIESKYRATTLSTFSLIRNIPYAFGATLIGLMISLYGAKEFSLYFGSLFVVSIATLFLMRPLFAKHN